MMTRLFEEGYEPVQEINHFEEPGVKREKFVEPDRPHLEKEIMDVIRCAIQVVIYYDIENEIETTIEQTYQRMVDEGLIDSFASDSSTHVLSIGV